MHAVCERADGRSPQERPEYYDDEELDRYAHRPSDSYTDDEVEQFRYVLYTMWETDVPGWVHSLGLRDINLPDSLKPETMLIISEQRTNNK